jgi:hypothetical protein
VHCLDVVSVFKQVSGEAMAEGASYFLEFTIEIWEAPRMKKPAKIIGTISLLLILVSFPTCYVGELIVRPELGKLSPQELELRQFDIEYVRWLLPGAAMFLAGITLAASAVALGVSEYVRLKRMKDAGREH